jgi:RND family efflux transporter MFP subunit
MKLKLLAIIGLLAAGGAAVFLSLGGQLPLGSTAQATEYITSPATTGDVTDEVAATGTIAPAETYALGFGATPQLAGDTTPTVGTGTWTVTAVNVTVGQSVKAGEVLATASTADLEQQLAMANSSLLAARLQEKQARTALDDASGTDATRQAKINYQNAVNGRRQAQQDVADIREQMALAALTAPIDGVVASLSISKGLDASGTALTLASSAFEVTADVVESDVSSMSIGQAATVTVDAIGASIGARCHDLAVPSSSSGSGGVVSYPVTVTLTGAPSALRAGMTADISIVTATANNVLTIPTAALRGTTGSYRVQVLGADGRPVSRDVAVGLVTSSLAEVSSGLSEGELVVTGTASELASSGASSTRFGGGIGVPEVVRGGGGGTFTRP